MTNDIFSNETRPSYHCFPVGFIKRATGLLLVFGLLLGPFHCAASPVPPLRERENPYWSPCETMDDFIEQRRRMGNAEDCCWEQGWSVERIHAQREAILAEWNEVFEQFAEKCDQIMTLDLADGIKSFVLGVIYGVKSGKVCKTAGAAVFLDAALKKVDATKELWDLKGEICQLLDEYYMWDEAFWFAEQRKLGKL